MEGQRLGPLLRLEVTRLGERRLRAVEQQAQAEIARGRHEAVVDGLRSLLALHPLREELWVQLMIALSGSDRRAEALDAYVLARSRLAEELGVEPGARLQRLHTAILREEHAQPMTRPAQLPADLSTFTGRGTELTELLAPGSDRPYETVVVSVIDGMAGIGKTALAVHAAHRLVPDYPDGQVFVDLHGFTDGVVPVDPGDALDRMLRSVGVPAEQIPRTVEERAGLWRTRLAGRRMLIVLDNAATETQVGPLLPGAPGCLVLITCRRRLAGLDDTRPVSLGVLPPADAVTLFTRTAGADRLAGATAMITDVVELCGRLPLAIRIAAARFRHRPGWTVEHLADRLRDRRHALAELEAGPRSVTAAFHVSYAHLDPDRQRLFRLLGSHPGPDIDIHAAAALAGTTAAAAERLLDKLIDDHLLQQNQPGRYQFHDLVRAYAAGHAACDESERDTGWTRLLDHYAAAASAAMDMLYPHEAADRPRLATPAITALPPLGDRSRAATWLDAERANLLAAAHAAEIGWPGHTVHLATTLHRHLRTRARYADAESLHITALAAARRTGDRAGEVANLNGLGQANRILGRNEPAAARYGEALDIARAAGLRAGEHEALWGLGNVHRMQDRYEQASDCYRQALDLARADGHRVREADALVGLGDIHYLRGAYESASDCYEQAIVPARAVGHHGGELDALNGLGSVHRLQGRLDAALECYQRCLDSARAIGHRLGEFNSLIGLATMHLMMGRPQPAIDYYQQILKAARAIGDRNYQFEAEHGLGNAHQAANDPGEAIAHQRAALDLARELAQPADMARAHDGLARIHHALDRHTEAHDHWRHTLSILTELGVNRIEDITTDDLQARLAEPDGASPSP